MNIALIIIGGLLCIMMVVSATGKLRRMPAIVDALTKSGVKPEQFKILATLQLLGALGIVVGIWIPIIGVLAALGLTLYFLGAIIVHIRAKDLGSAIAPPVVIFILALVTLVLELKR